MFNGPILRTREDIIPVWPYMASVSRCQDSLFRCRMISCVNNDKNLVSQVAENADDASETVHREGAFSLNWCLCEDGAVIEGSMDFVCFFATQANSQETNLEADVGPEVFAEMKAIAHASGKDSQKSKKAQTCPRLELL